MNCYHHPDVAGVAQCRDCEKALCQGCVDKFKPILCNECLLGRADYNRTQLIKNGVLMVILFIVGFKMGGTDPTSGFGGKLLFGYLFAGIPFGWSALTKITPNIFMFLSWFGWLLYFSAKFTLALFIGMFVTPFKIFRMYKETLEIKEVVAVAKGQAG